jgi:dTDP-4-dehydrorhamnose 3,5-epimerase-like enzyme
MNPRRVSPVFEDERGSVYDVVEKNVGHVGMITSKKGTVRGNHYHKESTQYTFVISGKVRYTEKDLRQSSSKRRTFLLSPNDLIETPPHVAHVFRFLEDSVIIDLTTKSRNDDGYEDDTVRLKVF